MSNNSYCRRIARAGKLLNTMSKGELKALAKSKDDKAREFVLSKEHFEKQQAREATSSTAQ